MSVNVRLHEPVFILAGGLIRADTIARHLGLPIGGWELLTDIEQLRHTAFGSLIADLSARSREDYDALCCIAIARGLNIIYTA
jgi:hypothetical protein